MDEMIMQLIHCQKSVCLLKHFVFSWHTRECKDIQFTAQTLFISLQAASLFLKIPLKIFTQNKCMIVEIVAAAQF